MLEEEEEQQHKLLEMIRFRSKMKIEWYDLQIEQINVIDGDGVEVNYIT